MSMKTAIRAFGIGLFVAGASLSLVQMKDEANGQKTTKATETLPKDTVSIKETELRALKDSITKLEKENKDLLSNKAPEKKAPPAVISYTVDVRAGMGTSEVSKTLHSAGVIKNANDFESFIVNAGKSSAIQLGKSEVSSDMTQEEILQILTKRK